VTGYQEFAPPAALRQLVACTWRDASTLDTPTRVLPDGCLDILWQPGLGLLSVVGADTGPVLHEPLGTTTYGVRLRASAAGAVLGVPASELLDTQIPLTAIWPGVEALDAGQDPLRALGDLVAGRAAEPDRLVAAAAGLLGVHGLRVSQVADRLGVTQRTLHRRMTASVGYGPKTLARVARLRRLVASSPGPLAERATAVGYASQSHMSDEVQRLTGLTPVRFLEDVRLTTA
jgi:AraC-like DNA-binding protein